MWVDYCGEVLDSLRFGFVERNSMIELVIEGSNYVFDFLRMLQIDLETGNQRSIAWIDEHGKCFFPKEFVGNDEFEKLKKTENPNIEIKTSSELKLGKRVREVVETEEEEKEVTSSYKEGEISKRQRLVGSELKTTPRWPNMKFLREEEDNIYTTVRNIFLSGVRKIHPDATITSIHQCARISPLEKARLEVFSKQMEISQAARGTSNTVYAWYGASPQTIADVLAHGFGLPSNLSGSDANFVGVYLSPIANPLKR